MRKVLVLLVAPLLFSSTRVDVVGENFSLSAIQTRKMSNVTIEPKPNFVACFSNAPFRVRNFFTNQLVVDCIEIGRANGIPASVMLAQAALESGWGESLVSRECNNIFGIRGYGSIDKKCYRSGRCYRAYKSHRQSIEDYAEFIKQHISWAIGKDAKSYAIALRKARYSSSSDYDKKIIALIQRWNLEQFDKN